MLGQEIELQKMESRDLHKLRKQVCFYCFCKKIVAFRYFYQQNIIRRMEMPQKKKKQIEE